jgi:hypothetical protein
MDLGPCDYGSIMHYDAYAFSSNGQPTIVRRDGGGSFVKTGMLELATPSIVAAPVKWLPVIHSLVSPLMHDELVGRSAHGSRRIGE